jgi:hypothetical protein
MTSLHGGSDALPTVGESDITTDVGEQTGSDTTAIRPFQVGFPDVELDERRRRINATRWPERETVTDGSQGAPLAMMQDLARYWGTEYDWRNCEAPLNALPQGRLYQLVRAHDTVRERTLEITFLEPGAEAYVFTFG